MHVWGETKARHNYTHNERDRTGGSCSVCRGVDAAVNGRQELIGGASGALGGGDNDTLALVHKVGNGSPVVARGVVVTRDN